MDRRSEKLAPYRAKRHFEVTSEPPGAEPKPSTQPRFMVHKHDARRLHYDLRLELEGVLASFAIPKGPSYDPAQKRLAVQTEDHPLEYGDFEGRIPDGEYGAGDSIIWDRGSYDSVPPGQAAAQLKKGHLHLALEGEKLKGQWHLVRTRPGAGGKQQWLFFKAKDGAERRGFDVLAERPESVLSGRRATRGPTTARALRGPHPSPDALLERVWPPMLAVLGGPAPEREYLYEVKSDGFRALAAISGGQAAVKSRNALELATRFPWVVEPLKSLGVAEAVLDGELIAVDEAGVSSFQRLGEPGAPHLFAIFDLLWLEGADLRGRPLEERRELLESVLANCQPPLALAERVAGTQAQALASARQRGLEGVIAKRRGSLYAGTRSPDWKKLKVLGTAELAIAGYTPISNGTDQIGALLVASRQGDRFVFAGKVGTGFDTRTRKRLLELLKTDQLEAPAVEGAPRYRDAHWVKPRHLAQLQFSQWTRDGKLRHPSFQGLREDKPVEETQIEPPVDAAPAAPEAPQGLFGAGSQGFGVWHSGRSPEQHSPPAVPLTNPDRVLFPKSKLTKRDLSAYYQQVAAPLVEALRGRPLSLQQWPRGIGGPGFFRHAAATAPEWITRATIDHQDHPVEHLVVDRPQTVAWLANQSALTLHMTASRVDTLDQPDWVAFDFDPADDDFAKIVPLAQALRGLLEELGLQSVPKTSGQRGLHVFVPIAPGHSFEEVHAFASGVARVLTGKFSKQATTERSKSKRKGRLYLDVEQNARLKTMVAPYSVRAVEGAPVSAPLKWEEVTGSLDPMAFTIQTLPGRLERVGDLFRPALGGRQRLPQLKQAG